MKTRRISRAWIRFNVVVQIFAALLALVVVNYLGFEHFVRWDLSRRQKFVLAEQTRQILRDVNKPLTITAFFSPTTATAVAAIYPDVRNLLNEFVFSSNRRVRVRTVDPVRDLAEVREAQATHKFRIEDNILLLEYDGRTTILPIAAMAEFDYNPMLVGGEPRLVSFNGEAMLASACLSVMSPTKRTVYFLQGHGETRPGGNGLVSRLTQTLALQRAEIKMLGLGDSDVVPEDCSVLMIAGAQNDLSEREISILQAYRDRGGAACVLLDPNATTPRLDAALASMGIRPRNDRVLRTLPLGLRTGILREVTAEFLPKSPIMRAFAGQTIFFPGATKSLALENKIEPPVQLAPLIQPLEQFWGEMDYAPDLATQGVNYDDGRDTGQPLFLAVSSAQGVADSGKVDLESAKLVVVGSFQFVLDSNVSQEGIDFLSSSFHWLLDRQQFTGTAPKLKRYYHLNLAEDQLALLSAFSLLVLPSIAALIGLVLAIRRRK